MSAFALARLLTLSAVLTLASSAVFAAPVFGEIFKLKDPDGGIVEVRIWGDEFFQIVESLDGYTLIRDPESNFICYAKVSADQKEFLSTGQRAGRADPKKLELKSHLRIKAAAVKEKARQARAAYGGLAVVGGASSRVGTGYFTGPVQGTRSGLCVTIQFPDLAGTIPVSEVNKFCNHDGYSGYGNNGSVKDYFYQVSGGKLTYTNTVVGYYTAQRNKSYYDSNQSAGTAVAPLIQEVLNWLAANNININNYQALNLYYAGTPDSGWAKGLWPHMSYYGGRAYQITNMGTQLSIGTFCHENGHMICTWPDLYDYASDGVQSHGAGRYCLMSDLGSASNPLPPCAYLRYRAGWSTATELTSSSSVNATLAALSSSSDQLYRFAKPSNSKEYFLFEVRNRAWRDQALPSAGLALWHIDENGGPTNSPSANEYQDMTSARHFEATLVQADGRWDLERSRNGGDNTDLYYAGNSTQINDSTTPHARWWDGSASGMRISNISAAGSSMTFTIGSGGAAATLSVTAPNGGETLTAGASSSATWTSSGDVGNVNIELSTDGGATFPTTLVANTANDGNQAFTVPNSPSTTCRVRVRAVSGSAVDTSNNSFTIAAGGGKSVTLTAPNGGESLTGGSQTTVTWSSAGGVGNVTLELSTDGGGAWVRLAENIANDSTETLSLPNTPSSTCLMRISETASGIPSDQSDGVFTISSGTGTANDHFANRITLLGAAATASGNNASASKETGEPDHAANAGGKSLWWTWIAPVGGTVTLTTSGSNFDTLLGVYTGNAVGSLTTVASNDDEDYAGGIFTGKLTFTAVGGTAYQIAVDGFRGQSSGGIETDSGNIQLALTLASSQASLTLTSPVGGENWVIGQNATVTWTSTGTVGNVTIALYINNVFDQNLAAAVANSGSRTVTVPNSPSALCKIQISDGSVTNTSPANFTISNAGVGNDDFANAATLSGPPGSASGSSTNATKQANEPAHAGNNGGKSLWWKWTPTQSQSVTLSTLGSNFDTLLAVYTGSSLAALNTIDYNDDENYDGGIYTSALSFTATAGTTYYIAVDGYDGDFGTVALALSGSGAGNGADLVIDSLTHTPATLAAGASVTFTIVVRNQGTVAAQVFSVGFWANRSSAPGIGTEPEVYGDVNGLNAGESISLTYTTTAPGTGAYTAWAYADRFNGTSEVPEGEETNNAGPSGGHAWTVGTASGTSNDDFANRATLSGSSAGATGSSLGATREADEPDHAGTQPGKSLWWTWTAPASGAISISTANSTFDTVLSVYTGAALTGLTSVMANDDESSTSQLSKVEFTAQAGTTYQIVVDGYYSSAQQTNASGDIVLRVHSGSTNEPPTLGSTATANPEIAGTGQSISFTAAATDPDDTLLTYSWNFGDGTTGSGASTTHAYTSAGIYTAVVTVSDGVSQVNGSVSVEVFAAGATTFNVSRLAIQFGFTGSGRDGIDLAGTIVLPQAPTQVEMFIGDYSVAIPVDAKGKGASGAASFRLTGRTDPKKLRFKVRKASLFALLQDLGFTNENLARPGIPIDVPVQLLVDGATLYSQTVSVYYTASAGKKGKGQSW